MILEFLPIGGAKASKINSSLLQCIDSVFVLFMCSFNLIDHLFLLILCECIHIFMHVFYRNASASNFKVTVKVKSGFCTDSPAFKVKIMLRFKSVCYIYCLS